MKQRRKKNKEVQIAESRHGVNGVKIPRRAVRLTNVGQMAGVQGGLVASCLGDLEARPIVWLWAELLARGMVTTSLGVRSVPLSRKR
jgi:hypothetical protein